MVSQEMQLCKALAPCGNIDSYFLFDKAEFLSYSAHMAIKIHDFNNQQMSSGQLRICSHLSQCFFYFSFICRGFPLFIYFLKLSQYLKDFFSMLMTRFYEAEKLLIIFTSIIFLRFKDIISYIGNLAFPLAF